MIDEGAARKKPVSEEYQTAYERIYGWQCFYCKGEKIKADTCPRCNRTKEEAKL